MKKRKKKLIKLIVKIYANYNKEYLLDLIQSKIGKECSREILDLLNNKELKFDELSYENENDINLFQKNLLSVSNTKEEINYIIRISEGLINSLKFIKQNCKEICVFLEKNAKFYKWNTTNYLLSLSSPKKDDNIDEIYKLLSDIIELTKDRNYKIINFEDIFEELTNLYLNEPLDELCKLNEIIGLLKSQKVKAKIFDNFYNSIHKKGMSLIKTKKLKTEEIIKFMVSQDIFYYNPIYKRDENRDPSIFSYIPITDNDKDYLNNIELIKKNRLWEIYSESSYDLQKRFYEEILEQMKKIRDFNSLFDIFPIKYIKRDFALLINGKVREVIYSILEEKEENYDLIFKVFDNLLICNDYNDLKLSFIIESVQINYEFPSKYYFYLLKNKV